MDKMAAITLWQPWATFVAIGAKRFEFREWPAPKRLWGRRIAIHAGARKIPKTDLRELLVKLQGPRPGETGVDPTLAIPLLEQALSNPTVFPLGVVVCTAGLGKPLRNEELARAAGFTMQAGEISNWGWPMLNVERLDPPIPARGDKGFWDWTPPADRRAA